MNNCKPGKMRNPKTNRCASPKRIKQQENDTYPDIPRDNGRCVHISKLNKLTITDLRKVICEHQIQTSNHVTKKILIDQILTHLGIEIENKCNIGYELNPTTNRCIKSCNKSQIRNPKTKRCNKI